MYEFIHSITPDVGDLISVLYRRGEQKRLHFLELFIDREIKEALLEMLELEGDLRFGDDPYDLGKDIILHKALGYEVFRVPVVRKTAFQVQSSTSDDSREWVEEHQGPIGSWEDFEAFPWPKIEDIDLFPFDWMEKNLPEGMGCFDLTAHIYELLSFLFGFETLCMKLYDDPELIQAVAGKIGTIYVDYTRTLADYDCIPLMWSADDFGFKSSLLIPPDALKEYVLPWHAECAAVAHDKGKPYLLHSCGNLGEIMDDLIIDVKIDGKHSFEDKIMPVTEAARLYGDRISIIGGIDLDFLIRSEEKALRKRVRDTIDVCMGDTGYCFGTGNSVANYVPVQNYCIMLDEAYHYTGG